MNPFQGMAEHIGPMPLPTITHMVPISWDGEDGPEDFALLTIGTPGGINSVFITPEMLQQMHERSSEILDHWNQKAREGIVVANGQDMKAAQKLFQASQQMKKKGGQ